MFQVVLVLFFALLENCMFAPLLPKDMGKCLLMLSGALTADDLMARSHLAAILHIWNVLELFLDQRHDGLKVLASVLCVAV